jgi:hypothetical protein
MCREICNAMKEVLGKYASLVLAGSMRIIKPKAIIPKSDTLHSYVSEARRNRCALGWIASVSSRPFAFIKLGNN